MLFESPFELCEHSGPNYPQTKKTHCLASRHGISVQAASQRGHKMRVYVCLAPSWQMCEFAPEYSKNCCEPVSPDRKPFVWPWFVRPSASVGALTPLSLTVPCIYRENMRVLIHTCQKGPGLIPSLPATRARQTFEYAMSNN
jgi:hypothetical protein